jgi:hypothetical protein
VIEEPSFLLGQNDHPSSPVGEPFEQDLPPTRRGIREGECTPLPESSTLELGTIRAAPGSPFRSSVF